MLSGKRQQNFDMTSKMRSHVIVEKISSSISCKATVEASSFLLDSSIVQEFRVMINAASEIWTSMRVSGNRLGASSTHLQRPGICRLHSAAEESDLTGSEAEIGLRLAFSRGHFPKIHTGISRTTIYMSHFARFPIRKAKAQEVELQVFEPDVRRNVKLHKERYFRIDDALILDKSSL